MRAVVRWSTGVLLLFATTALAGCAQGGPQTVTATATQGDPGTLTLTGTLAGFHEPQAQCAYLQSGGDRLSLDAPDAMTVRFDPDGSEDDDIAILDPSGAVVASEGDLLEVVGEIEDLPAGGPCGTERIVRATELNAAP